MAKRLASETDERNASACREQSRWPMLDTLYADDGREVGWSVDSHFRNAAAPVATSILPLQ